MFPNEMGALKCGKFQEVERWKYIFHVSVEEKELPT